MKNKFLRTMLATVMLLIMGNFSGCRAEAVVNEPDNYKHSMIDFVADLSKYSRNSKPNFQLITNNGTELYAVEEVGEAYQKKMLQAVDGALVEGYFYGWEMNDDKQTPFRVHNELGEAFDALRLAEKPILNIDYCIKNQTIDRSIESNKEEQIIGFGADRRGLDDIPAYPEILPQENSQPIERVADAKNFLALFNPEKFKSRRAYLMALAQSKYDILIIDAYYGDTPLTADEVNRLKTKPQGGKRLVLSYISIGEAEDYRPYWQEDWFKKKPVWLAEENEDWEGNYKVKYWRKDWQDIIFGSSTASLDIIIRSDFDGVFLDIVDAFQYFEELNE